MKTTIMNTILTSERFAKIQAVQAALSAKYGNVVVAGGSLADCFFNKSFYDIDCFISYKDLNPQYRKDKKRSANHIIDVLRDEVEGFDIDIIVVDYSVAKHIRRFDQSFKQIWYDNNGLNLSKQAVDDLINRRITINTLNGPVVYFRVLKSARKYNLSVDPFDMWLMENFLSCLQDLRLPSKYASMQWEFLPHRNPDELLGRVVFKYSRLYWDIRKPFLPSWTMLKKFIAPYVIRHKLNK